MKRLGQAGAVRGSRIVGTRARRPAYRVFPGSTLDGRNHHRYGPLVWIILPRREHEVTPTEALDLARRLRYSARLITGQKK